MHVVTSCTPAAFMRATCAERSVVPNGIVLSVNTTLATGYFLNELISPVRQSADCCTLYARMPTFVAPMCCASHGRPGPPHVKHSAASFGKKFVGPVHSRLM